MFSQSMVAEGEDERTVALSARRSEHVPTVFENSGAPRGVLRLLPFVVLPLAADLSASYSDVWTLQHLVCIVQRL